MQHDASRLREGNYDSEHPHEYVAFAHELAYIEGFS